MSRPPAVEPERGDLARREEAHLPERLENETITILYPDGRRVRFSYAARLPSVWHRFN
jgi:hypothetical protein